MELEAGNGLRGGRVTLQGGFEGWPEVRKCEGRLPKKKEQPLQRCEELGVYREHGQIHEPGEGSTPSTPGL